jgi:hypothetical protein
MADDQAARLAEVRDHSGAQAREPEKQAKTLRLRVVEMATQRSMSESRSAWPGGA